MPFKKPNPEILRAVEVQNASDAPVPVTIVAGGGSGLTDTELRATPVPVSVSGGGGLTDAELRATAVPVSLAATPLPTGAATGTKQDTSNTSLASLETKLGEVQASPTANTVLDRLKALLTGIVLAAGTAIIGKVGIDQTTPGTTNKVSIGTDGTVELGATALAALETITVASVSAAIPAGDNNIGNVDVVTLPALPAGTNNIGDVDVASIAAGETHVGQIGTEGDVITVTLSLNTSAYADGDVMADTQTVGNAVRVTSGRAILQSISVVDEDDQGQTFDVLFFSASRSLGTENSAPNISDANARDFLGSVRISSGDYLDLGGVKVATKTGLGLVLEASGSRDLYLGTIIRGAATYTAAGVQLRLGLLWD